METSKKGGRNAHGHNGPSSTRRARKPGNGDSSGTMPTDDELDLNPHGRFRSDGSINTNQTNLFICTYNVRTLRTEEDLEALLDEIVNIKWHIIGLAETRRPGNLIKTPQGGHTLFTTSATSRSCNGVGFLVHKDIAQNISEYKEISDRIATLKLQINKKHTLRVIQVYAPTSSHDEIEVEDFYNDLDQIMSTDTSSFAILMGDFNAKVGLRRSTDEKGIGAYGIGDRNERGDRLMEFVASRDLVIGNTLFKKPINNYWTWESPNGRTHNVIDFILCDHRRLVMDVGTIPKVDTGSDHRFVRAKVRINKKFERMRMIKKGKSRSIDIELLSNKQEQFQLELNNKFSPLKDLVEDQPLNQIYEQVSTIILEEAEKLAKRPKTAITTTDKQEEEIWKLNEKRKELRPSDSRQYITRLNTQS
ncbi:hypothetical protein BSL78_20302 [Apostichopus japonicus]|uniref:Endonuclease/exonuclease/phosphatase domain-containing protein n=1 Tax=Stichopus japonicus TaxID=307972 RepID=A0A2G8K4B6_STIJA|nr:hypothetical protein BSL78_20302 [Apostichopus japonicus]